MSAPTLSVAFAALLDAEQAVREANERLRKAREALQSMPPETPFLVSTMLNEGTAGGFRMAYFRVILEMGDIAYEELDQDPAERVTFQPAVAPPTTVQEFEP